MMAKIADKIEFAPVLTINRKNFESTFKLLMKMLISQNKIDVGELRKINRELSRWLITGMQNVDFKDDFRNEAALDNLVDDLWSDFYMKLNLRLRKHRTKFRRKQL